MASSAVQVFVLEGWLCLRAHADTIRVRQLSSCVTHCLGPEVVSQLGSDDLSVTKEGGAWVLTFILYGSILCSMEMSIL